MKINTQVGIIGAGPAGLTLALLLHQKGIQSIVLEAKSQEYIEKRVRAGLLEQNTVELLDQLGVSERLHKEGQVHHGCFIHYNGEKQHIDFNKLVNKNVTIYAQQEIIKDLIKQCRNRHIEILFEANATQIEGVLTDNPSIKYTHNNIEGTVSCNFIAGTDGFHGIARKSFPTHCYNEYQTEYPFSWMGILAYSKPSYKELIYAYHTNGFALASMRSEKISRLYLQVSNDDHLDNWPDDRIWEELEKRLGIPLNKGEIFDKGITPMRSFMIDNMQYGSLYLAGDSAHIVPPTGAKGLNLAIADVRNLANGIEQAIFQSEKSFLKNYTKTCLARVWRVQDFSNFMTYLCHKQSEEGSFEQMLQKSKFNYLRISESYQRTIAENYVGLPFELFE
jgi:p-hydroxybenzoate 3-monooxygenase